MKFVSALIFALAMTMMVASVSFAHPESECGKANTKDYKAVPKTMHEKVFPNGHPTGESWLNHCYYDVKEEIYFCADKAWQ